MISTGRFRLLSIAVPIAGLLLLLSLPLAQAQEAAPAPSPTPKAATDDATLFRVFLRDGSTLVSYGEFAHVADKVVLTLPLDTAHPPTLQMVSIPADSVDWERTDAYAESARAARYAVTRGSDDYALLESAVTRALNDIALNSDPERRIAMATEARQSVTRWAADHYGYRASDVSRLASLFDDAANEARRAAGKPSFDLSLVASMAAPPSVPLLPAPDRAQILRQDYAAAMMSGNPAERTSLLSAISASLAGTHEPELAPLVRDVHTALAREEKADRDYAALTRRTLRAANLFAGRADVEAIDRLAVRVLHSDDRLGHERPNELASLLASLDAKLDAARRLRLARDQWEARRPVIQAYRRAVAEPSRDLRLSLKALEQIEKLAGPSPAVLKRASSRISQAAGLLGIVNPPPEMAAAHALLKAAIQLAERAVTGRTAAVQSGEMQMARDASAAAAGALSLFGRATDALQQVIERPQLK
jgi:hypothetical protein